MLTTKLDLIPTLRMSGFIPLFPHTPSLPGEGQLYVNKLLIFIRLVLLSSVGLTLRIVMFMWVIHNSKGAFGCVWGSVLVAQKIQSLITATHLQMAHSETHCADCRLPLKCDGTRTETRFRLSTKRTSSFKSAAGDVSSVDYWQPRCAHQR
jgi:hypothetical protein